MSGRRRLPLVTEQSLAQLRQIRTQLSTDFERELLQQTREAKVSLTCRAGCANCCHHPVLISAIEGTLIYRWLAERGRWTPSLRARLKEHAEKTKDLPFEVWFLSVIPCPLLDEKTSRCSAYQARPYPCRVTYSIGDSENCHPHKIDETGLVNKREVMATYHREQNQVARKHGLQMVLIPLSMAVLLGERVVKGEIELDDTDREVLREYEDVR